MICPLATDSREFLPTEQQIFMIANSVILLGIALKSLNIVNMEYQVYLYRQICPVSSSTVQGPITSQ